MKRMKRMMALVLTVIMTMAMSVTAFAAENEETPMPSAETPPKGTLTVELDANKYNTLEGQTIELYKLFDLTVNDDGGHAYKVNPAYEATLTTLLNITSSNPTDADYYAKIAGWENNGTDIQKFANDFAVAALTNNLEATVSSDKLAKGTTSHAFDNLEYGYYLVYQTGTKMIQSSLVSLDKAAVTVKLKGEALSITKTADKETVEIGNIVTYTITGTIPDATGYAQYQYIIHDTLNGLSFVADASGTEFGNEPKVSVQITGGLTSDRSITLSADKKTMDLNLSEFVTNFQSAKGQTFTVTYYAKADSTADVNTANSATLEYGNAPGQTIRTTPVSVVTPTYPLNIKKTNTPKAGEQAKILDGATFRLYRTEASANAAIDSDIASAANDANVITVSEVKDTEGNPIPGKYTVDPKAATTDMVTVAADEAIYTNGYNLQLNGLAAGDYWLVEMDAPDGYNRLTTPVKVTFAQDKTTAPAVKTNWTVSKSDGEAEGDKTIDIQNNIGTILPGTGGLSTMILTVISIVLVLGVAVSFIISRRRTE